MQIIIYIYICGLVWPSSAVGSGKQCGVTLEYWRCHKQRDDGEISHGAAKAKPRGRIECKFLCNINIIAVRIRLFYVKYVKGEQIGKTKTKKKEY